MLNDVKHQFLPILPDTLRGTYLGQTSADRTGLLGTEVKGQVLLVLVELPEVLPLLLVHDGQHPRDRLADGVAISAIQHQFLRISAAMYRSHLRQLRRRTASNLLHPQGEELVLQLSELLRQVILRPKVEKVRSQSADFLASRGTQTHLDWSS